MINEFSYADFLISVQQAREKIARFHRVDLHLHTIDSHDYPSIHDKEGFVREIPEDERGLRSDPVEFQRRFLERAKLSGLSLVAVTDHNESGIAATLSQNSDQALNILPGIEISVRTNLFPESEIHLLGIFPQGTSSMDIDKVFPPGCGMPESGSRGPGACVDIPIVEIINSIHALGGICIAAHVSSSKGVRVMVHSQNVEWLQKNYLRRYLKSKEESELSPKEHGFLERFDAELKPFDDEVQNAYLSFLADHQFDAIQIQEATHQEFYSGYHVEDLGLAPFACLLSSDAHTLADIGCEGHVTYVKMTNVNLQGLTKALSDPGTRIRYDTNIPTEKPNQILGIAFEGGSFDGEVIGFSGNLTTLIGGRGTGKSALIESIRYLLQNPIGHLPSKLSSDIENRLAYTLRDSEVKLIFRVGHSGESIILKRRYGEEGTTSYSIDGNPLPEIDLPGSKIINAEIFGWSEIEELSDSPRKQLALIDATIQGFETFKLDLQSEREKLRRNGDDILSLTREIQSLLPLIQDSDEVRRQLSYLDDPALNAAFERFDQNEAVLNSIDALTQELQEEVLTWVLDEGEKRNLVEQFGNLLEELKVSSGEFDWSDDFHKSLSEELEQAHLAYAQLVEHLTTLETQINLQRSSLEEERLAIEANLNVLSEESGRGDFKSELSRRKELTERLSKIEGHERSIETKNSEIKKLFDLRREQIIPSIVRARTAAFDKRTEKADVIASKLSTLRSTVGISIKIIEAGDKQAFSRALGFKDGTRYEGLFKGIDRQYLQKDYPGYYSSRFSPFEFVDRLLDTGFDPSEFTISYIRQISPENKIVCLDPVEVQFEEDTLVEFDENGLEVDRWSLEEHEFVKVEKGEDIWNHLSPYYYDNEIHQYMDPDKLADLFALELVIIEDLPRITLDGVPIEELSPGQRCSSIIPIILVEGDSPLVIDQPEDNLDNKLVFDLVVDILRNLKEKRQIIVASHNPNIPVSGDAEQVVVFEASGKESCRAAVQASIDDETIVSQIKAIMEGGDKAFEMRVIKYGVR